MPGRNSHCTSIKAHRSRANTHHVISLAEDDDVIQLYSYVRKNSIGCEIFTEMIDMAAVLRIVTFHSRGIVDEMAIFSLRRSGLHEKQ